MTDATGDVRDAQEQTARIWRALEETEKFIAEGRKLSSERDKLSAERDKMAAERDKLAAEALKLERDRALAPWQIVITSMAAGAALFGAGAAFVKLLGP